LWSGSASAVPAKPATVITHELADPWIGLGWSTGAADNEAISDDGNAGMVHVGRDQLA
jgi:hypothetical protein